MWFLSFAALSCCVTFVFLVHFEYSFLTFLLLLILNVLWSYYHHPMLFINLLTLLLHYLFPSHLHVSFLFLFNAFADGIRCCAFMSATATSYPEDSIYSNPHLLLATIVFPLLFLWFPHFNKILKYFNHLCSGGC